jgi:hypothetical protein
MKQLGADHVLVATGAEWLRDLTDAEGEETDMRRDAFICGIGWSISELEYETDPEGRYAKRRLDPTKVQHDPNARQSCAVDARYVRYREQMSKDEFKDLYGNVEGVFDPSDGDLVTRNADPRMANAENRNGIIAPMNKPHMTRACATSIDFRPAVVI